MRHFSTCSAAANKWQYFYHNRIIGTLVEALEGAGIPSVVEKRTPEEQLDGAEKKKRIDIVATFPNNVRVAIDVSIRTRRRQPNGKIDSLATVEKRAVVTKNNTYPPSLLATHNITKLIVFVVTPAGELTNTSLALLQDVRTVAAKLSTSTFSIRATRASIAAICLRFQAMIIALSSGAQPL